MITTILTTTTETVQHIDVVWSIIVMMVLLLMGVGYVVYYIIKIAYEELNDGSNDTPESEELLQLPSDRDQQSS